jgi:hypothetical protein
VLIVKLGDIAVAWVSFLLSNTLSSVKSQTLEVEEDLTENQDKN